MFDDSIDEITSIIENATKGRIALSASAMQNLVVHIAIAIERIRSNCYVRMNARDVASAKEGSAFAVALEIGAKIESRFEIDLPEDEVAYISIHLAGKRMVGEDGDGIVISDEIWNAVARMLDVVWGLFRIDLRDDIELRFNLARHIVPLATRLRYNMMVENPLLSDVKSRFPLAFAMATEASSVLSEVYGRTPSEGEIGYITFSFALALERRGDAHPKKSILLVCASGVGSARLLEHQCRREFGEYLDRIEHCDVSQVANVDLTGIDYVLSTVPIGVQLDVPILQIGVFLDDYDIRGIRKTLEKQDGPSGLGVYFKPELFVSHMKATERTEALGELCERMIAVEGLDPEYTNLVFAREGVAPTAFGDMVAIPHPIHPFGDVTRVAVGVLDSPVEWNGHAVRVIFLLSICEKNHDDLEGFYAGMVDLINDSRAMEALIDSQKWTTLISLIS